MKLQNTIKGGYRLQFKLAPIFLLFASCGEESGGNQIYEEAIRQQKQAAESQPDQVEGALNAVAAKTMTICAKSSVPSGWIKVNDHWNPTRCGNPTTVVYNVWTIEEYASKPKGATMSVCASAATPNGWTVTGTHWIPTKCGHPVNIVHNVKTIKRVN